MNIAFPYTVGMKFPSDLEIIPSVRKFVSEVLQTSGFSAKFAFRTEIIVDAVCNNAITYGCDIGTHKNDAVDVTCVIREDRVEVIVKDTGGNPTDIERLKDALNRSRLDAAKNGIGFGDGMGLEVVKLLSEAIELNVDENNLTSIRVTRRREDM